MSQKYSIYFAGDLFNHKDLIGNLLLSEAIEKNSAGRLYASFRSIWNKVRTAPLTFAIMI